MPSRLTKARLLFFAASAFFTAGASAQNPDNEGSRLEPGPAPDTLTFSWDGKPGRTYFVLSSESLAEGSWSYLPIIESGAGSRIAYGLTFTTPRIFYRLRFSDQPTTDPHAADFDGDSVSNWAELQQQTDPFSTASLDGDLIPDDWEKFHFGNFSTLTSAFGDHNATGWTDIAKLNLGLDPKTAAAPTPTGAEIGNTPTTPWPWTDAALVRQSANPRLDSNGNELLVGATPARCRWTSRGRRFTPSRSPRRPG